MAHQWDTLIICATCVLVALIGLTAFVLDVQYRKSVLADRKRWDDMLWSLHQLQDDLTHVEEKLLNHTVYTRARLGEAAKPRARTKRRGSA